METKEIKLILQKYFNGESTAEEERKLGNYFQSENIAEEIKDHTEFFSGISQLESDTNESDIEEDVMDFILENEHREKIKYFGMWKTVTGIAASIVIVLGGFLFYQQKQKPFDDTFENPEEAYAYATQTLQFVSGKYSKGLAQFSNFEKLKKANEPIKKGISPINDFYGRIEKLRNSSTPVSTNKKGESINFTDSI